MNGHAYPTLLTDSKRWHFRDRCTVILEFPMRRPRSHAQNTGWPFIVSTNMDKIYMIQHKTKVPVGLFVFSCDTYHMVRTMRSIPSASPIDAVQRASHLSAFWYRPFLTEGSHFHLARQAKRKLSDSPYHKSKKHQTRQNNTHFTEGNN